MVIVSLLRGQASNFSHPGNEGYNTPMLTGKMTRRRKELLAAMFIVTLGLASCMGQTRAARLQDDAREYNMALRFGRMSIARSFVDDKAASEFVKHYAPWGQTVRVVDMEYQGVQYHDPNEAVVTVKVGWQRFDGADLRVTQLQQLWRFKDHEWKMVHEKAAGGDTSLFVVHQALSGDAKSN